MHVVQEHAYSDYIPSDPAPERTLEAKKSRTPADAGSVVVVTNRRRAVCGACVPLVLPTTHTNTHGRIGSWIPHPGSRFRTVVPATTGTMQQLTSDVPQLLHGPACMPCDGYS